MNYNEIAKYLYELGHLKRIKRTGWWLAGIKDPESVAEHSYRTAILGYLLASLDGADPKETAMICLFHDAGEARIIDLPRVARRYIPLNNGEEEAVAEQATRLPEDIAKEVVTFFHKYEERAMREAVLAKDADLLECIVQAREYQTQGYTDVDDWIRSCYAGLTTEVAKSLADACLATEPKDWWQGLKIQ